MKSPPRKSWQKKPHEQNLGTIFEDAATVEKIPPDELLKRQRPVYMSPPTSRESRIKAKLRKIEEEMKKNPKVYYAPKGGKKRKSRKKKRKTKKRKKRTKKRR